MKLNLSVKGQLFICGWVQDICRFSFSFSILVSRTLNANLWHKKPSMIWIKTIVQIQKPQLRNKPIHLFALQNHLCRSRWGLSSMLHHMLTKICHLIIPWERDTKVHFYWQNGTRTEGRILQDFQCCGWICKDTRIALFHFDLTVISSGNRIGFDSNERRATSTPG